MAAEINGQLYAIHADHLHTPRRLTDSQGRAVWQWVTSAFGEVEATQATTGFTRERLELNTAASAGATSLKHFSLRYPGQQYDEETGLHYNHHRYYDPYLTVGYTQADPLGLAAGWNRFAYVSGNPINFVDPEGLQATLPHPAIGVSAVVIGLCAANKPCREGASAIVGFVGGAIGGLITGMTSHGNVADTQIVQDYSQYASNERLCGREPMDRCAWLALNAHNYPPAAVKSTEKAWGCRGSRHGKGGRGI